MPILYSKESLQREEAMIKRGIKLYEELLEINLVRQLKIAEADLENGEAGE